MSNMLMTIPMELIIHSIKNLILPMINHTTTHNAAPFQPQYEPLQDPSNNIQKMESIM